MSVYVLIHASHCYPNDLKFGTKEAFWKKDIFINLTNSSCLLRSIFGQGTLRLNNTTSTIQIWTKISFTKILKLQKTLSAIQEWLQDHTVPACPGKLLLVLAGLVQEKMGGTSGAVGFTLTLPYVYNPDRQANSSLFSIPVVQPVFNCSSWTSNCGPE